MNPFPKWLLIEASQTWQVLYWISFPALVFQGQGIIFRVKVHPACASIGNGLSLRLELLAQCIVYFFPEQADPLLACIVQWRQVPLSGAEVVFQHCFTSLFVLHCFYRFLLLVFL